MITDRRLRSQVDALWDKFWTGRFTNLYEPPLDIFGADTVERWFTENQLEEVVKFANSMKV